MRRRLVLVCTLAIAGAVQGQQALLDYVPPPEQLGADRNDGVIQYNRGIDNFRTHPERADSAFLWTTRLVPQWGTPMYGRAILQAELLVGRAVMAAQSTEVPPIMGDAETKYLDSLRLAAQTRDPFPDAQFQALLIESDAPAHSITIHVGKKRTKLKVPKEFMEGEQDYAKQDFKGALAKWAKVVQDQPSLYFVHQLRGDAFYQMQAYDSAIAQLVIMGDSLAKHEQSEIALDFDSRAMVLYSIAYIHVQKSDYRAATLAYKQALEVDFGFYMAHARLAGIALQANDMAAAQSEMQLAMQQNDSDPFLLFQYAYILNATRNGDEAIAQLRKAIAVDPYFAAPYEMLGRLLDAKGRTAEAIVAYQGYVDHAPRNDPALVRTVARVATLLGSASGAK